MTFNGVYGGEDYDARLDEAGWDRMPFPADPANAWKQAVNSAGPGCALRAALQPPVKVREVLTVPEVTNFSAGVYAYDFKSEFSGWPVLRVAGAAGTIVRLTPAELDDGAGGPSAGSGRANIPGGMPDQRLPNFGPAYWTYTLAGVDTELYRPKFFTYGFRHLLVEVLAAAPLPGPPNVRFIRCDGDSIVCRDGNIWFENITNKSRRHLPACSMCERNCCADVQTVSAEYAAALSDGGDFDCSMLPDYPIPGHATILGITGEFIYTTSPIVANFSCSNELFNGIHHMILSAMKSNLQGIFTDCPHRERLGWLEQSWLLAKSVSHNFGNRIFCRAGFEVGSSHHACILQTFRSCTRS